MSLRWLGRSLIHGIKCALARYELFMTIGALFSVAPCDMELALEHSAVRARVFLGSPIVGLGSIRNSRKRLPREREMGLELSLLDLFRPALDHPYPTILNEAFCHGPLP